MRAEVSIEMGWVSTTGDHWHDPCDLVTEDAGQSFRCRTHTQPCVFDEGWRCPMSQ